jgi:hypothetical protein
MKTTTNNQPTWADKVVAHLDYNGYEILLTAGGDYKVTYAETEVSMCTETFRTEEQARELISNGLNA